MQIKSTVRHHHLCFGSRLQTFPEVPSQCLSMWWRGDTRTWPFWQDMVNQSVVPVWAGGEFASSNFAPSCPLPAFLPQGSGQHYHLMPFLTHTCFLLLPVPDGHHPPFFLVKHLVPKFPFHVCFQETQFLELFPFYSALWLLEIFGVSHPFLGMFLDSLAVKSHIFLHTTYWNLHR